jgi:Xaa-Pro aminopeptidase
MLGAVRDILLCGDTQRSPALRHELPIAVGDPFLFAEVDGQAHLLTSSLERVRMAAARPDAVLIDYDDLGFNELTSSGLPSDQIRMELISRAAACTGVRQAIVDFDFPLGVAERLRADGIELSVDEQAVRLRRRVKSGVNALRNTGPARTPQNAFARTIRALPPVMHTVTNSGPAAAGGS